MAVWSFAIGPSVVLFDASDEVPVLCCCVILKYPLNITHVPKTSLNIYISIIRSLGPRFMCIIYN